MIDRDVKQKIIPIIKNQLENGSEIWLRINGKSMFPFIDNEERVLVKKKDINYWKIGDIGLYKKNDILLTHRIIAKRWDQLLLKGDQNLIPDQWVNEKDIWGKIISIDKGNRIWNLNSDQWCWINSLIGLIQSPVKIFFQPNQKYNNENNNYQKIIIYILKVYKLFTTLLERILIFGR